MKPLKESLFDSDLVSRQLLTLFNIAKDHTLAVRRYEFSSNAIQKFVDQTAITRAWKKSGSPLLNTTHISPSTLSNFENKVVSTILDHIVMNKDCEVDNDELNAWLEGNNVFKNIPAMTSRGKSVDLGGICAQVYFIDPREKGAWMHKNFKDGPILREYCEIEVQFRYKGINGLAFSIEMCLSIKGHQLDEILEK